MIIMTVSIIICCCNTACIFLVCLSIVYTICIFLGTFPIRFSKALFSSRYLQLLSFDHDQDKITGNVIYLFWRTLPNIVLLIARLYLVRCLMFTERPLTRQSVPTFQSFNPKITHRFIVKVLISDFPIFHQFPAMIFSHLSRHALVD